MSKDGDPLLTQALAFMHVCDILELDQGGHDFLTKYRIRTVRKLISTADKHLVTMITKDPSVLNHADVDQIQIFRF